MIDDKTKKMFDDQCELNDQLTENTNSYIHDITILLCIRQLLTPNVIEMINITNDADIQQMLTKSIDECMDDMNEI